MPRSAPMDRSSRTSSTRPRSAARCSGVNPYEHIIRIEYNVLGHTKCAYIFIQKIQVNLALPHRPQPLQVAREDDSMQRIQIQWFLFLLLDHTDRIGHPTRSDRPGG